jgi:FOG: HEAT repeat
MVTYRWEFIPSKDMQRVLQQRLEESQKKQNNPAPESKPINNSNQKMSFFNSTREMFMGTGLALMAQAIVLMPIVIKFFDKMNEVRDGYIAGSFFAAMLGAAAYFIGVLPLERIGRFIKSALNKQDNLTEETQSGTIKSIGIISLFSAGFVALSASLGWTADGSIQETAGWIGWAMEHWEISGMGIIGGTVLFLMAWKRYFPVSWYLWRLNSRFEKSRSNAAKALGKLGDKRAVESLIGKLYDENASVCEAVATALGKLGDKRAIKALMNLSTNSNLSDIGINRAITMAINKSITSKEELFDVYLKLLTSSNRWTRINAVTGLEELGDKRAIGPLLEKLKDADTQWHAHGALNTLGASKQELVKGFLEALRSGDYGARRDAIRNLKQFGDIVDKRTLKPLLVNFYISDLNYHPTDSGQRTGIAG